MKKCYFLLLACLASCAVWATDFTKGVFFVNEDWMGHNPSSVNFLADDGTWTFNAFQAANPGRSLGNTCDFATVYGGKIYFVSKQTYSDSTRQGGRLVVADAETLVQIASHDELNGGDGRAFVGASAEKGYISTSNGVLTYDIAGNTVGEPLEGLSGEYGTLLVSGNYLFALGTSEGLRAINLETDQVAATWSDIKQITRAKDGTIWCYATGMLTAISPTTLATTQTVTLDKEIEHNQWAWNAGMLCASAQTNTLYWGGTAAGWYGSDNVWKLDLDAETPTPVQIFDVTTTDYTAIYGATLRVDPVSDHIYMEVYKDYSSQDYCVIELDADGGMVGEYPLTQPNYWFPALPVFPDSETVTGMENTTLGTTDAAQASLDGQTLHVNGCAGQTLTLYRPDGVAVTTIRVDADRFATRLDLAPGIYLLRGQTGVLLKFRLF